VDSRTHDLSFDLITLESRLSALWNLGRNSLVGWRPDVGGIQVLAVPFEILFRNPDLHRRIFSGRRRMGLQTFHVVRDLLGVTPAFVQTDIAIGDGPDDSGSESVERLVSLFAVTRTRRRAVFLVDISGFSLSSPEQQAAQLTSLQFALNTANRCLTDAGHEIELARTTTGDGFYVWNRAKGFDGDVKLFALFALTLIAHAQLQAHIDDAVVPQVRACFGIGSHYSYRQAGAPGEAGWDFIVGDVTVQLARLIETTRHSQILFADFNRIPDDTDTVMNTEAFMERATRQVNDLSGIELMSGLIEKAKIYLTGPRVPDAGYVARRISVLDKHSIRHDAYNAKISAYFAGDDPLYLGLREQDLMDDLSEKLAS
jgi:class 3 adenylate cyclase